MPFNYKSPGVYVEEVDRGARPIESAGTSVLALIGLVQNTIRVEEPGRGVMILPTPATPTLVTNWTQFTNIYGDFDQAVPGGYLHQSMYGFFLNGGTAAYVVGIPVKVDEKIEPNVPALPAAEGYLLNPAGHKTVRLLTAGPLKPGEEITIEVQPPAEGAPEGTFNLAILRAGAEPRVIPGLTLARGRGQRNIVEVLARESENLLKAEVVEGQTDLALQPGYKTTLVNVAPPVLPVSSTPLKIKDKLTSELFRGNAAERTGIAGLEAVDEVTLLACPDVVAGYERGVLSAEEVKTVQLAMLNHCESMKDRFAILDTPPGLNAEKVKTWRSETMNFDSKYGALYYPWIKANGKLVPPSGHLAGVYSRVDSERGVHKAPANEQIRGVVDLELKISRNEQDLLNPIGVNCIRSFPGQGIRIWGARTLSSDAQWRYINVRRLFCNIEKSILQGTSWIVFEPNDQILWRAIKRDITAYLSTVWQSGALFGATQEQAFYVKCDEETNPPNLRDLGYCIIEVGIAPVKPAEFVIFRISQSGDGSATAD